MSNASQPTVKSAMRTLDIIEFVVAHPSGVVAQQVATALGIPVSSLSYLLATLCERHYLRRDGRRYVAGDGLDRLRRPAASLTIEERVGPQVSALGRALNETTSFFVLAGWELEARVTETADQALRYSISAGARAPLHCMAAGKAMLATFDDTMLDRYFVESERPLFTQHTIGDERLLRREIAAVRESGWAFTDEEFTLGVCGLARAIVIDGAPVGALAVALPKLRYTNAVKAEIMERLSGAAELLSRAA